MFLISRAKAAKIGEFFENTFISLPDEVPEVAKAGSDIIDQVFFVHIAPFSDRIEQSLTKWSYIHLKQHQGDKVICVRHVWFCRFPVHLVSVFIRKLYPLNYE